MEGDTRTGGKECWCFQEAGIGKLINELSPNFFSERKDTLLIAVFSTKMSDSVCQPTGIRNKDQCYCKPLCLW